jgi:hypothetical protein
MSQSKDSGYVTFTASAAITQYALVKYASGKVTTCGLSDRPIGVAYDTAFADGDEISVKLLTSPGTFKGIAKEAMSVSAIVYTEAGGKIQDTAEATALPIGQVMEAATAENDIVEWLPIHYGGVAAS